VKHKGNIKKHYQRKNPCEAIYSKITIKELLEELNKPKEGYTCNKCNKIFNTRQGKYQHQKRCKQDLVVFEEKKSNNEEIEELKNELKLMKELFIENMKNNNITNIDNSTNNNNITNNNTNLFISFNDKENLHKILKQCKETIIQLEKVRSKDKCFAIYINAAHFNPEHPEAHNIRLTNLKPDYKLIDIRDENGKWKKEPQKAIFNNLISSSKDFMMDIVKDNNPDFDKCLNIDHYEGDDEEKKIELIKQLEEKKSSQNKLHNIAKSVCYNKTKELKIK
jgi:hypothetical protein